MDTNELLITSFERQLECLNFLLAEFIRQANRNGENDLVVVLNSAKNANARTLEIMRLIEAAEDGKGKD